MDEKRILELACARLGYPVEQVLSYRVYEDQIVFVVESGPKHRVPLAELEEMDAKMEAQIIEALEEIAIELKEVSEPEIEPEPPEEDERPKKIDATRGAKRLAKEHGIDLATMQGTGPGGRILHKDVEAVL